MDDTPPYPEADYLSDILDVLRDIGLTLTEIRDAVERDRQ
jgi:hypothetical protein